MKLIDEKNAETYLRETARIQGNERVEIHALSGGVSNFVMRVSFPKDGRKDFIVKQAREQLRVADPWFCSIERIWREVDVMKVCFDCLGDVQLQNDLETPIAFEVPQVLFEDRENYLFAMSAAAANHEVWKTQLLRGEIDPNIASACGRLLGSIHQATWLDQTVASRFHDRQFFEDLRVDPYYRHVAGKHADLADPINELIQSLSDHSLALVHGDFSPKNLLIYDDRLMLVDFEVGHFGDPAFDLGFFLSHLALKAIRAGFDRSAEYFDLTRRYWDAYQQQVQPAIGSSEYQSLVARSILNFAGCMLARVDGKSKVEYLVDEQQRDFVRRISKNLLLRPVDNWENAIQTVSMKLNS